MNLPRRVARRRFRWTAALTVAVLVMANVAQVNATRGGIVALDGSFTTLFTGLRGVDAFVVDDSHQRLFVASKIDNTIYSVGFDGVPSEPTTTFAQPSAMAVGGGNVYALLAGTGQIVRLDPITLAPTVVVGGLVNAQGLAYTNGFLYTFSAVSPNTVVLRKVNPDTGSVTATGFTDSPHDFDLYAYPQLPDVVFATRNAVSPGGLHRYDLVSGATTYGHESPGTFALLPDGDLISSSGISDKPNGVLARNASNFEMSGRRWTFEQTNPSVWAASPLAVAIGANNFVELASTTNTAERYRRYTFLAGVEVERRGLAMSLDSSKLFVAASLNGTVRIYSLPGVGVSGAPQSQAVSGTGARVAAGKTGSIQSGQRVGATPPGAPPFLNRPSWEMSSIGDLEFGSDGLIYVSDPFNGVVNMYGADGLAKGGWRQLDGVDSLAELNGAMYGLAKTEGSVLRLDPSRLDTTRIARNIPFPSGLTAANGKLFTTYYLNSYASHMASVDPSTGVVWKEPSAYGLGLKWDSVHLAEQPIAGNLVGNSAYMYDVVRFSLSTLTYGERADLVAPLAVAPDGQTVIDATGKRANAVSLTPDGFVFPGTKHAMSGLTENGQRYVAAVSGTGSLVVYDESNPGSIVFRSTLLGAIERVEFRPGSSDLWVGAVAGGRAYLARADVASPQGAAIGAEFSVNEAALVSSSDLVVLAGAEQVPLPATPTPPAVAPHSDALRSDSAVPTVPVSVAGASERDVVAVVSAPTTAAPAPAPPVHAPTSIDTVSPVTTAVTTTTTVMPKATRTTTTKATRTTTTKATRRTRPTRLTPTVRWGQLPSKGAKEPKAKPKPKQIRAVR